MSQASSPAALLLDRRAALFALGAAAAAPALAAPAARGYPWPLGMQLWSVNKELDADFEGTLRKVAALGYVRVESAGLRGRTPQQFRAAVQAAGLRCDAAHMSMPDLQKDMAGAVATARAMGVEWLICSSPRPDQAMPAGVEWIPGIARAMTLDAWRSNAAALNRLAALAKPAGIKVGYHNHPAEFGLYDGRRGYDVLLAETDPRSVSFELDVAWAVAGGVDPFALLAAHRGRFVRLHLKDVPGKPPLGQMATDFATAEVGRGVIDWRRLIPAAQAAGVTGAYVEQEAPYTRPVWESLAISRDALRSL